MARVACWQGGKGKHTGREVGWVGFADRETGQRGRHSGSQVGTACLL
jgi:hypothetical protein